MRLLFSTVVAFVALGALVVPVLACSISVEPSSTSGTVGDTLDFTITLERTHRVCSVPIEDTQIYLTGMELVSETGWDEVSDMVNKKTITVRLTVEGEGLVEVVRVCSKGGDQCAATVNILPAAPGGDTSDEAQEKEATTAIPAIPTTPASPSKPQGPTFVEAFAETIIDPYIILLVVLMLAGVVAVARGCRRIRPFAMLVALGYFGFYIGGCPCPIGALQNAFIHFRDVTGYMFIFVQLGVVLLMALLVGRVFCGWACPMGATQYFLYRKESGKKVHRFEISREQHNVLRWMKYGMLVVLIGLVLLTRQPLFEEIDPFKALFNLDFSLGMPLLFLVVLLAVSIVIGFPFCKYLCPLGAFLGLFQRFTFFRIRFSDACTNCGVCHTFACDYMAIERGDPCPTVNQMECVRCGECLARCPCNAISFTAKR